MRWAGTPFVSFRFEGEGLVGDFGLGARGFLAGVCGISGRRGGEEATGEATRRFLGEVGKSTGSEVDIRGYGSATDGLSFRFALTRVAFVVGSLEGIDAFSWSCMLDTCLEVCADIFS